MGAQQALCWEAEMKDLKSVMFWMLVVLLILTAIVMVGNWQLYSRVAHLETSFGLRATPQ